MDSESGFISAASTSEVMKNLSEEILSSRGGTCIAYKVFHEDRFVFVKQLKDEYLSDGYYREAFKKEFEIGSMLNSPYIPRYLSIEDSDETMSITMEYIEGQTLKQLVEENPDYFRSSKNTKKFLYQLLLGLECMHSRQIVHLDLKPDNIMLTKVNNDVRILDLGFSYYASMPFTQGRTSAYAAPEQLVKGQEVDARTDIFALGRLLEYISEHCGGLDGQMKKIMTRCLKEKKDERYQSVSEILGQLDRGRRLPLFIVLSLFAVLLAVCAAYHYHLPRIIHRAVYGYDVVDTARCWNILSDDSLTCEVMGNAVTKFADKEYNDVELKSYIFYGGKKYRVVQLADSAYAYQPVRQVFIGEGVERIGKWAFVNCKELRIVSIPVSVTQIGNDAFARCDSLKNILLPPGLKRIEHTTFHHTAISSIKIPEGVTIICKDAFTDCFNLTRVDLPSTLVTIERGVFYKCEQLEEITIPASVKNIGEYVFMENKSFRRLYNYAESPQNVFDLFDEPANVTVYVPRQSVELYKKAPYWSDCNIQPMP